VISKYFQKLLYFYLIFIGIGLFAQQPLDVNFRSRLVLANKIKKIKNDDSASLYSQQLLTKARNQKDKVWEAQILLAQAYRSYGLGDVDNAKTLGQQSVLLARPIDSITYVKANLLVAYMLNMQGKDSEALKIAFEITRKAEKAGWGTLLIECKICIADIYRTINEPQKGLSYAQQANEKAKLLKDTSLYISTLSTLSNLYSNRKLVSSANLIKATKLYEIIVNEPYVSTLSLFAKAKHLSNLARLYEMQNKYELAEEVLLKSIAISKKEGYKNIEAHSLNELMTVYLDKREYDKAINCGNRAVSLLSNENSTNILQRNIYRNLSKAYVGVKNFKRALDYNNLFRDIADSLTARDKMEMERRLDEEYKADKRVIQATANTRLMKQQRNFSIVIAIIIVLVLVAIYRWVLFRRKKHAALIEEKHKQLAKLNALKTKFFTNISHELRTPLTLIAGPIEQLQHEDLNLSTVQKKSYIDTIGLNTKKLLNLLNELLELSKLEAGSIEANPRPTDILQFVRLIFQGFSSAAEYKKIDYNLITTIEAHTIIEIDKEKLEKILTNLISNALKFTPLNGAILIEGYLVEHELQFKISDSGNGIPKEELTHIFDRYYQVNEQNQAVGGTGIGLAIAKELTEVLGGRISVESLAGKGSSFHVSIPVRIQNSLINLKPDVSVSPILDVKNTRDVILIVDDQIEMTDYISSILSPYYNLLFASNGVQALKLLSEGQQMPSLIISDVMMPEMDGFVLLRHLKAHEILCRIPVVMLTAIADETSKYYALNIGVDDYICKPFNHRELLARVSNLLNNLQERAAFMAKDQHEAVVVSPADLQWLKSLEELVIAHAGKKSLDIATISYEMAVSERQLFRNIKRVTGLTPNKYIRSVRLQLARSAIESGKYKTISEIAYLVGFDTPAYFSKLFKEYYGRDVNDLIR
jgi:signal transduction histidine kinase/DNA-binding response OmpR family regulator